MPREYPGNDSQLAADSIWLVLCMLPVPAPCDDMRMPLHPAPAVGMHTFASSCYVDGAWVPFQTPPQCHSRQVRNSVPCLGPRRCLAHGEAGVRDVACCAQQPCCLKVRSFKERIEAVQIC